MLFRLLRCSFLVVVLTSVTMAAAQEAAKPAGAIVPGSRVAIIGDSITEQKLYSKFMEAYLLACTGVPDVHVFQFGWSGETAGGFANRADNDLMVFKPTVATLCYGMNDGGYQPYRDEIGKNYEGAMRNVVSKLEAMGVKSIVVGSPGAVDTHFFRPGQMMGDKPSHAVYNDNLARLRDIDRAIATEKKLFFADVHATMLDAMLKAQTALGKEYDVCGKDGFHPGNNGQLLMAQSFLKGLGLDGSIGEIVIDIKGSASASQGHKVLSGSAGKVELESTRWPFCFQGDEKSSWSTRSIAPFTSFPQDLNRLILKVKGLESPNAVVKWGDAEKKFTREQLTNGINLDAEFSATPFDTPFQSLLDAVAKKQNFETQMIKSVVTNFRAIPAELASDDDIKKGIGMVRDRLVTLEKQHDADVHSKLVPVKHTLQIVGE